MYDAEVLQAHPAPRAALIATLAVLAAVLPACGAKDAKPGAAPAVRINDPPSYPCRQILVAYKGSKEAGTPATRTKSEALMRATTILARLRAPGASFAAIAKETSDEVATAESGGFFGFVREWPGALPKIVEVAASLQEHQISDPVETEFGYHLIERLTRQEGMRLEAEVLAVVNGFFVPWHDVAPDELITRTKSVAYSDALAAVTDLRSGAQTLDMAMEAHEGRAYLRDVLHLGGMKPGFEELIRVALAAKPGEFLDPVDTPSGWAVFTRHKSFRALVRHILILHSKSGVDKKLLPEAAKDRTPDAAHEIAAKALEEVKKDPSRWVEIVAKYSDEPMSAKNGGSIGDVCNTGPANQRWDPALEIALQKLKPGEISEVVASRAGWHILWRVD